MKERDKFYKSVSYGGTGGASGHDAPMIAYDVSPQLQMGVVGALLARDAPRRGLGQHWGHRGGLLGGVARLPGRP